MIRALRLNKIKFGRTSEKVRINKKAQYNFVLIFASIAGAMILLLAIYGAVKAGGTIGKQTEAELAKSIDIITNPLQAGFAEGATSQITFKKETRITNDCNTNSRFGENRISVQTKSSIGDPWSTNPLEYALNNKYLFSEIQSGKKFYVYSKPFYTGYKVTDLLFMSTGDYCFITPPEEIAQEIIGLNVPNIGVKSESGNNTCAEDAKKVCFGDSSGCDISVKGECNEVRCKSEYDFGFVTDESGNKKYFSGNLILGAILSESDIYECNVKRLLYRSSRIADILSRKTDLMAMRGCSSLLKPDLDKFAITLQNATSANLETVYYLSNDLEKKNLREGGCKLW